MSEPLTVYWFRQDLRLRDNPALTDASIAGDVLPIYVLDDESADDWRMGAASRWWLHHSLCALSKSLDDRLAVYKGDAREIIPKIAREHRASRVVWTRCYEPWRVNRDQQVEDLLGKSGISTSVFDSALLFDPRSVFTREGAPYRVFTPFFRECCRIGVDQTVLSPPRDFRICDSRTETAIASLDLLPEIHWYAGLANRFQPGETGGHRKLSAFLQRIDQYPLDRDRMDLTAVSQLSPHLHFGELSPRQLWCRILEGRDFASASPSEERFLTELGWREFSYYLLHHYPQITHENFRKKFDEFDWRLNDQYLTAWQNGKTGYPIVDAAMRELWETGYMHNRARMIVASFLVKNLRIHWLHGARWFWDTLVDADLANNSASWQWVAGSGADAAPYFRIFNPILQGRKFDPSGDYVRRYVPELAELESAWIHQPTSASRQILTQSGVEIGETYPAPIVDLAKTRTDALSAYSRLP